MISGRGIEYVKEWKYLGANVVSGNSLAGWLSFSVDMSKFYCAFNSILHSSMNLSEKVLLKLLYSNCISPLTYAAKVKDHSAIEMRVMNTAINDALRRIFSYQRWESVRSLRESHGYESIYIIYENRKRKFYRALRVHPNSIIREVFLSFVDLVVV